MCVYIYMFSGWWFQPLWKISVSWDYCSQMFPIYGKIQSVPTHHPVFLPHLHWGSAGPHLSPSVSSTSNVRAGAGGSPSHWMPARMARQWTPKAFSTWCHWGVHRENMGETYRKNIQEQGILVNGLAQGKIETGNHRFSYEIWRGSCNLSRKPIHWQGESYPMNFHHGKLWDEIPKTSRAALSELRRM